LAIHNFTSLGDRLVSKPPTSSQSLEEGMNSLKVR